MNEYDFRRGFETMRPDNFSYEGLGVLFNYFERLEEDMGEEFEYDVIAFCCEYSELTLDEVIDAYSIDVSECEDITEKHAVVADFLNDNTILIGETDNESYLFQVF